MIKFLVYSIVFIVLVLKIKDLNPHWLDLKRNIIVDGQTLNPGIPLPFNVNKHSELSEPTFQYRENIRRTGVSKEILTLPLKKEKSIGRLNFGIHGASKSSVSADEFGVLVPTDSSWVYHFDHNYNLTWKFFISESSRGIHGTAVLTKDAVYFGGYNGRFYALDRKTGEPLWVYKVGGAIGASPVLWNKSIYVAVERVDIVDGYLVKLNAETGALIWKTEDIGEQAHSSPAIDPELGLLYFGANNEKFFAIQEIDGKIKWEYIANGPIKGTPSVSRECVVFTDWSGRIYCLRGGTGSLKWTSIIEGKSQSSPTVIEDINRVIVSSNGGNIWGFRLSDGQIIWNKKVDSPIMMGSATAYKDAKSWNIVTTCSKSKVCIMGAKNGKLIEELPVSGLVTSVPTLFKGKVYITTSSSGLEVFSSLSSQ